jgi:ribosomal protein L32
LQQSADTYYSPACPALTQVIYVTSMGDQEGWVDCFSYTRSTKIKKEQRQTIAALQMCKRMSKKKRIEIMQLRDHWCILAGGAG